VCHKAPAYTKTTTITYAGGGIVENARSVLGSIYLLTYRTACDTYGLTADG
jgi:hypothetical protein